MSMNDILERQKEISKKEMIVLSNAYFELTRLASWLRAFIAENQFNPICDRFRKSIIVADKCYAQYKALEEELNDLNDKFLEEMDKDMKPFGDDSDGVR